MEDVEKILFVGDVHGDFLWLEKHIKIATNLGIPIIQLGDFGYWVHKYDGEKFFQEVVDSLVEHEVDLYFIRGNHEYMSKTMLSDRKPGLLDLKLDEDGLHYFLKLTKGSFVYISDGTILEIGGKKFGFIGGAVSIDKEYRVPGISYWVDEEPVWADAEKVANQKIDVLVSHETPEGPHVYSDLRANPNDYPFAVGPRKLLREVVDQSGPELCIHGHWHHLYQSKISDNVRVCGVGANIGSIARGAVILNVEDLSLYKLKGNEYE